MAIVTPSITRVRPPRAARLTLAEFHALPEGPPYYEFECGELIPMNRPHERHQKLLLRLGSVVDDHVTRNRLGSLWPEVEVDLTPERGYVPDLAFLATEHLERVTDEGLIAGAPDLVIEITSPSTRHRDRVTKLHAYRQAGVPWYWIVDPDDLTVEEYRLTPEGYLVAQSSAPGEDFQPGLFPGLTINLAELLGVPLLSEAEEAGE